MNKIRVKFLTIIFCFIFSFGGIFIPHQSDQSIAKRGKVTICHIPLDNPANYKEINVSENAIPDHLSHGDCPGPCVDSDADGIPDCNDLCPNRIVDPGEQCDPPGFACDGDGDGLLEGFCDAQCQCPTAPAGCGDGNVDSDEQCDDGNRNNGDGCRANCTLEICGDGIKDPQEGCDDGNKDDGDGCSAECASETTPSCDDGITNGDETGVDCGGSCDGCSEGSACSDSNDCQSSVCFAGICQPTQCGDGVCNGDETPSTCPQDCGAPACGDGECNGDETPNTCPADCGLGVCGDGVCNSDETSSTCPSDCAPGICGDGVQDTGEECDDGNNVDGDGCHGDCTIEGCGDGIIDSEVFVTDGISSFFIDTYEASRPDADSVQPGVAEHRACSSPDKQPWVNVTWTEADAACTAAGKRLCTEEEWQLACEGTAENMFPYGNDYDPMACNGKEYDPDCSPPDTDMDTDMVLPTGTDYGCPPPGENSCESEFGAFDMSGNVKEWTATQVSLEPPAYRIRGGAYDTIEFGLTCQFDFVVAVEDFRSFDVGFRCCRDPQCSDGVQNGNETDIDCGGPDCAPCLAGRSCNVDSDCLSNFCDANVCQPTSCGDGVVDPGEQCDDGNNADGDGCSAECLSERQAPPGPQPGGPVCGNGVREEFENCDGADLGGVTCTDFGFSGGTLTCDASCNFDTSGCTN